MAFSVEDATYVADMRLKMVQNMQNQLPPEHGIDKDELKRCLEVVRKDRTLGDAGGSKAKGKAPVIPLDLEAFMKKP